jgi:hypothetical protein
MNDCVYTAMVDAGIAEKLEEKIIYDKHGEITINKNELYGQIACTKFNILNTYYLWMKRDATLTGWVRWWSNVCFACRRRVPWWSSWIYDGFAPYHPLFHLPFVSACFVPIY